jgi:aminoglycoside 2'-N-acetyltransferase I
LTPPVPARLRRLATDELSDADTAAIRELLWAAFPTGEEAFTEDDWQHALGGRHFVLDVAGEIVAHASVVERELHVGEQPVRTGYVEAVATQPRLQGLGLGTIVMAEVGRYISENFELGALGTGSHHFYGRLGWRAWQGPTYVRTSEGLIPTPDDNGYVLVLVTPTSPPLDMAAAISCEWRPGDAW